MLVRHVPSASRELEALSDERLARGLDDTGTDRKAAFDEGSVVHAPTVLSEVRGALPDLVAMRELLAQIVDGARMTRSTPSSSSRRLSRSSSNRWRVSRVPSPYAAATAAWRCSLAWKKSRTSSPAGSSPERNVQLSSTPSATLTIVSLGALCNTVSTSAASDAFSVRLSRSERR